MSKISVVFWTQGGNTESMANAIVEGIKEAGKEAEAVFVSDMNIDELKGEGVFALGCPAMGAEVLEESEMEPFVADVEGFASGKKIGLFGSYGWGDGQWMRDWEARMSGAGATIVGGAGCRCNGTVQGTWESTCKRLITEKFCVLVPDYLRKKCRIS